MSAVLKGDVAVKIISLAGVTRDLAFYLRNINQISHFLPRPTKERVVNAIITSRLDYCNALLYSMSAVKAT